MKSLCIIPARGGSKRIPRKNIRAFRGKPIMAYSIETAIACRCFDSIMVSTDDQEIARVVWEYGAEVPFMRSECGASDMSTISDVIAEVLDTYAARGSSPELVCCILPTAPLLGPLDVRAAVTRLRESADAPAVVPLVRYGHPIQRAFCLDDDGHLLMVSPQYEKARSQDLPPRYHDAGQYYVLRTSVFHSTRSMFPPGSIGVELQEARVQDIDSEEDWALAEAKHRWLHGR